MKVSSGISILQFNGTDCSLSQDRINNFDGGKGFTIDAWVNRENNLVDTAIFEGTVPAEPVHIGITAAGILQFNFSGNLLEANVSNKPNSWFHFLCEYDRTLDKMTLCINGALVATSTIAVVTGNINLSAHFVGRDKAGLFFKGSLAVFRIWTGRLEDGDYTKPMNTIFNKDTPNLFCQYNLCDGSAGTTSVPNSGWGIDIGYGGPVPATIKGNPKLGVKNNPSFAPLIADKVVTNAYNRNPYTMNTALTASDPGFSVEFWWQFAEMGDNVLI